MRARLSDRDCARATMTPSTPTLPKPPPELRDVTDDASLAQAVAALGPAPQACLLCAASVASLLLTTDALVSEMPSEKESGSGHAHAH